MVNGNAYEMTLCPAVICTNRPGKDLKEKSMTAPYVPGSRSAILNNSHRHNGPVVDLDFIRYRAIEQALLVSTEPSWTHLLPILFCETYGTQVTLLHLSQMRGCG